VLQSAHPILVQRVAPFFAGKDAREIEALVDGVYLHQSNYKWQGLPFWSCVASVELAVLDILGQVSGRSLGDLLGGVKRREIAVYRASGHRGNTEEELDYLGGSSRRTVRRPSSSVSARMRTTRRRPGATTPSSGSRGERSATG
jgi:L-alanine-DL-glutamate epimerase-like enolase superfamily enzyme